MITGDEVVVCAPYWVVYADMGRLSEAVPVIVPTRHKSGCAPRTADIKKAFTARTRAVIVNSPSNPTGAVFGRDTLQNVIAEVRGKEILIVSDELKTLPVGVQDLFSAAVVDWGLVMAAGMLITIPALAFFMAVQRHLVAGWGTGGLKA